MDTIITYSKLMIFTLLFWSCSKVWAVGDDLVHTSSSASLPVLLNVQKNPNSIEVTFTKARLADVLKQLQEHSGIRFEVYYLIKDNVISGHFVAPDWPTLIDYLLKDFSYLKVYDRENKPQRIMILSEKIQRTAIGISVPESGLTPTFDNPVSTADSDEPVLQDEPPPDPEASAVGSDEPALQDEPPPDPEASAVGSDEPALPDEPPPDPEASAVGSDEPALQDEQTTN